MSKTMLKHVHKISLLLFCALLSGWLHAAQRIIPQLKGTYTPFQEGVLAEHKGLSPLMGAIAWHSGWIAGFYTWGPGQRVEVAQARAGGATAAPAAAEVRKQFKLVDADKTRELLDYLFIDVAGDIQPTKLKTNPLFYIVKQSIDDPKSAYLRTFFGWIMLPQEARESVVNLLTKFSNNTTKDQRIRMLAIIGVEGSTERILPSKLIKFVDDTKSTLEKSPEQKKSFLAFAQWLSEGTDELKGIVGFLQKINESFAECAPDGIYPAFVTEQILSAYWYAIQFKSEIRGAKTIDMQMGHALPIYMQAIGVEDFRLTAYDIKLLVDTAKTCPLLIDELVLTGALFEKIRPIISLVDWSHFNYRNAWSAGNCVETMLLNFFNFILYDSETKTYRLSQLPPTLAGSINTNLRNFYANPENTNPANSSNPSVINEWLEVVSGLPGPAAEESPEYIKYRNENSYTYKGVTKTNKFVLASEEHTVLAVINYLLDTKAKNFEDLGPLLSPEGRIKITALANGGFNTTINYNISADFNVHSDHSFAKFVTKCESYGTKISVKDLDWLSYCIAAHVFAEKAKIEPVQWVRYLLYGAGKYDYNFLVSVLLSAARAMHAYKAIPDWLDTIFEKLLSFEQHMLDPFKNCVNEITNLSTKFNKDKKFVDLVIKAMVSEDEKFDDPRTAAQNILVFNVFLDKGFDINTKNKLGQTTLMFAAIFGSVDVVKAILDKCPTAGDAKDNFGQTALMFAITNDKIDVVKAILDKYPTVIDTKGNYDQTALMYAVHYGKVDVVKVILDKYPTAMNAKDNFDRTALMYAAHCGKVDVVKAILDKYPTTVDAKDRDSKTALMYAKDKGDDRIVELIENALREKTSTTTVST